jgi:hypothetical protein
MGKAKKESLTTTVSNTVANTVVEKVIPEQISDPLSIINSASARGMINEPEDIIENFNVIQDPNLKENPEKENLEDDFQHQPSDDIPGDIAFVLDIPKIRKVSIKKIPRFNNRLGLEKTAEKFQLMPGVRHNWCPAKKGNEFITGLEDLPEERKRLEKALRVDLSNTSPYYATLSFSIEDKEHGQILNFDDKIMGPYYEVVYYAMMASDLIANGIQEYSNGNKPFAEWYIENKEAETEAKQRDMTYDLEAQDFFKSISHARRASIAQMLELPVWGFKDETAGVELWDWVKKSSINAKKLLSFKDMSDTEFEVTHLVRSALKFNVIRRNKLKELMFANEPLGATEEQAIHRLKQATNSTLRMAVKRQLEAKLR